MAPENPTSVERSWGRSPTFAVSIGVLGAVAWLVFMSAVGDWRTSHNYYRDGLNACRVELALRAVAVRRFAQRTGRLPESLSECEKDLVRIEEAAPHCCRWVIYEPWSTDPPSDDNVAKPPVAQDFLGLPIIYKRGQQKADDRSWFLSTEALPEELELYLKEHGGIPAPSVEPFALSSLFMRDCLARLHGQDMKVMMSLGDLLAGLVIIIVCTVILARRWRRFRPSLAGRVMVGVSLFSIVATMLFPSRTSCYVRATFISRSISGRERLRILDDAVKRGEVPEDVARTARAYIRKLSGDFNQ